MNDLEFFDLGIYEFEQQLINCVGKPSRCNEPASQVIQALNDKPPFCRIKRKIIVLLHLPFLLWYSAIIISKEVAQIECANKILKKLFVCEMKYMCFCRLIHCFMKSVISTRTIWRTVERRVLPFFFFFRGNKSIFYSAGISVAAKPMMEFIAFAACTLPSLIRWA